MGNRNRSNNINLNIRQPSGGPVTNVAKFAGNQILLQSLTGTFSSSLILPDYASFGGMVFASSDLSSSGQAIFNTGYKMVLIQAAMTSSILVGTANVTRMYGVNVPWSGSLAGICAANIGGAPGGTIYIKPNINSANITTANAVLTASNNASLAYPRGQIGFGPGSNVAFSYSTVGYTQAGSTPFVGMNITLWAYM